MVNHDYMIRFVNDLALSPLGKSMAKWMDRPHWHKARDEYIALTGLIRDHWPLSLEEKRKYTVITLFNEFEMLANNSDNKDLALIAEQLATLQFYVDHDGKHFDEVTEQEVDEMAEKIGPRERQSVYEA